MTPPRTLDEALAMVPEYVLLRPGVDVWHTQQRAGRLYDKWLLEQMDDV